MDFEPPPKPQFNSFYNVTQDILFMLKDNVILSFLNSPQRSHLNHIQDFVMHLQNTIHQKTWHVPILYLALHYQHAAKPTLSSKHNQKNSQSTYKC